MTADTIAKSAGVSKGTVFLHFYDMNTLIENVTNNFGEKLTLSLHEQAHSVKNFKNFLMLHLQILSKYENFYLHLISNLHNLPDGTNESYRAIQSAVSYHLMESLASERDVKDIPHHILFNMWIGLVHYYLQNKKMFVENIDESVLMKYQKELVDNYTLMIRKDEIK